MSLYKWEKVMIISGTSPLESINLMAWSTFLRESHGNMIGIFCRDVIIRMAVDAFYSGHIKPDGIFRFMALAAISCSVCSEKRKPAYIMYPVDIVHKP
jgi:hypothetical protein